MANSQYQKKADLINNKSKIKDAENLMDDNLKRASINEQPSSAEEFASAFKKLNEGYVIRLPKLGLNVGVKPPNFVNMFLSGNMPSGLLEMALSLKEIAPKKTVESMTNKELKDLSEFLDRFFCDSVYSPKFSINPQEGELSVYDIDIMDKFFIFDLVNSGVEKMEFFRKESNSKNG
jgi:hypothetical protein